MDEMEVGPESSKSPYAGRWVARVGGRVIAQGDTPEQALRASQHSRFKEKPEIIFMPLNFSFPPLFERVMETLPPDQEIYLVGGAVRDLLLSQPSPDLDFALPSNGIATARKVANALGAAFIPLDDERDTGRVLLAEADGSRFYIDFATYRGATLEQDLRARDFTMNAMAFDYKQGKILDPLGGGADLRAKVIRACSDTSITDDPVRILRAIRQAAAFNFHIDPQTRGQMKQAADQLSRISPERLRDEVFKILKGPKPDAAMRALEMLGILPHVLPELTAMKGITQSEPHVHDVWSHTLSVLDHLGQVISALRIGYDADQTNDMFTGLLTLRLGRYREQFAAHFARSLNMDRPQRSLLFFAALYHDACKPDTRTVEETGRIRFFDHDMQGAEAAAGRAKALALSNEEVERVRVIIKNHMRMHFFADRKLKQDQPPSRKAIYRFFRDSGEAGVDLVLLGLADVRGTYAHSLTVETWNAYLDVARILLENYWEHPQDVVSPPRLLNGTELMKELGLEPGPSVGRLIEAIRENQAAGKIQDREQALEFARAELEKESSGPS